jgi:hypothetical protein
MAAGLARLLGLLKTHGSQKYIAPAVGMDAGNFSRYVNGRMNNPQQDWYDEMSERWGLTESQLSAIVHDVATAEEFYLSRYRDILAGCKKVKIEPPAILQSKPPVTQAVAQSVVTTRTSGDPLADKLESIYQVCIETQQMIKKMASQKRVGNCPMASTLLSGAVSRKDEPVPGIASARVLEIMNGTEYLTESELAAIADYCDLEVSMLREFCERQGCPILPSNSKAYQE